MMAKYTFLCLCGCEFETDGYPAECPKCGLVIIDVEDLEKDIEKIAKAVEKIRIEKYLEKLAELLAEEDDSDATNF